MANISVTNPRDWKYISEGGATIVFSYAGSPNPHFDGTVLRLRKTTSPSDNSEPAVLNLAVVDDPDDSMIDYQHSVMERLIPLEYLPRLESVSVDRPWLETLVTLRDVDRPTERRQKDHIDVRRTKAVLATDLVGGQGLAVEIKPKWAFLPSLIHLSPATRPIKAHTCRFCMHSQMKSTNGETVSVGYCPLDLFSGDQLRITHAIHNLWDSWVDSQGSVNNLRIFSQGKMIKPTDPSTLDLVAGVLPHTDASINMYTRERFASTVVPLLMNTPVLRILCKLQRTLDVLDIEGLSQLWRQTYNGRQSTFLGMDYPNPSISDWTGFVDMYLSSHDQIDHTTPSSTNLRYYLMAYLLSATFKDCSIILKLDHDVSPHNAVTIIDLDPKGMDRLCKWEDLDKEIAESYTRTGDRKRCVDGDKTDINL